MKPFASNGATRRLRPASSTPTSAGRCLGTRLAQIDVRLEGPTIGAHSDGIATSTAEIEALIDIAVLWAERCEADA